MSDHVFPFPQAPQPGPIDFELRTATLSVIGAPNGERVIPPAIDLIAM